MKRKVLCLLYLSFSLFSVEGKEPQKKQAAPLQTKLINQQVSQLMADRVGIKKELATEELAPIESYMHDDLIESESLRFPADELYGSWDNSWVNPFRSKDVTFPDSFNIDCSTFIIPIDNDIKVTSPYGPRRRRMHKGIDLKVYVGDTIRTAFSGKVRIKGFERRGYGKYIVVRHPNGLETIYGHLSDYLVSENDIILAGQPIGLGGNTGRSTGPHLHFETRFLGHAINPSNIIDFENGTPHQDYYAFYKGNIDNKNNIYTSTSERIVYHRVKKGETLSKIALKYRISVSELCRLNGLSKNSKLRIGQSVRCGTVSVKAVKEPEKIAEKNTTSEATAVYHEVGENETLSSIAHQYGTTVDALCRLNNIPSTTALRVGQNICYRASSKTTAKQNKVGENENIEIATVVSEEVIAEESNSAESEKSNYHRVQKGETLSSLSRHYGIGIDELCRLNGLTKRATLSIGQNICYKAIQPKTTAKTNTIAASSKKIQQQESNKTVYYRVKQGDTLGAIAQQHGVSIDQLCKMNNITKTTVLKIGRSLRCS